MSLRLTPCRNVIQRAVCLAFVLASKGHTLQAPGVPPREMVVGGVRSTLRMLAIVGPGTARVESPWGLRTAALRGTKLRICACRGLSAEACPGKTHIDTPNVD